MSKQTSVDFLIEEFSAILGKVNFTAMQGLLIKDAVEKAREMEKEQITNAFKEGNLYHGWALKHEPEQYYNKTYKNEDK
jgi:hypothetical protein